MARTRNGARLTALLALVVAAGMLQPLAEATRQPPAVDWAQSRWISDPVVEPHFDHASWIWHGKDSTNPGAVQRYFRRTVTIKDQPVLAAKFLGTADDSFELAFNGRPVHSTAALAERNSYGWQNGQLVDLTDLVRVGDNTLQVAVKNRSSAAGLLGRFEIVYADGSTQAVSTDAGWSSSANGSDGWTAATVVGKWNAAPWTTAVRAPRTPVLLRHDFTLHRRVARATVHATALGLYELKINGQRVSADQFAPGWVDYHRKVPYQSYDVTRLLGNGGGNTLAATVAEGWYAGTLMGGQHRYGDSMAFNAQLVVEYADGSVDRIGTDRTWQAGYGPLSRATIYDGEVYDARREPAGWDRPGFPATGWRTAVERPDLKPQLITPESPPQQVLRTVSAMSVTKLADGVYRFDLGENISGHVQLKVRGPAGSTVELRHAEWLNADASSYRANLRGADATDFYTLAGTGRTEVYEPRFTSHGFRYVEVRGYPGEPGLDALSGKVVSTVLRQTGRFETSDTGLNTLQQVILNGQASNFTAVPTDCPQRDERLGWAGDTAGYAPTATFNSDVEQYLRKWVTDLREAQQEDGSVPSVAPRVYNGANRGAGINGWGDALVSVPWTLYSRYGDTQVLAENYEAMTRWVGFLKNRSSGLLQPALGYGDWLSQETSPSNVVNTAYFAQSARLLSQIAGVLGKNADQAGYQRLYTDIRAAFQGAYLAADGTVTGDSQTVYALTLEFGLVPEDRLAAVRTQFVETVTRAGNHLTTGYLGTPYLLDALTDSGRADLAYQIVQQDSFPSWLYMITKGSTTLWERWDSLEPDGSYNRSSFNHFALGAVGDWMYRTIAGLAPGAPGYQQAVIRPQVAALNGGGAVGLGGAAGGLTHASAELDTRHGRFASSWRIAGRAFLLHTEVATSATVYVPTFGGQVRAPAGARLIRVENGEAVYAVGAGRWNFTAQLRHAIKLDPVQVTVNPAGSATLQLLPERAATATFTAYNWMDRAVTVTPTATAGDGFTVTAPEPVTLPAKALTTLQVPVRRAADTASGTTGAVELTIAGDTGKVNLSATDNWSVLANPSASSTHSRFSVASVNDGSTAGQANYAIWNAGNGWNDATKSVWPDTLTLTWAEPITLAKAKVFTVDNATNPAAAYGLRDYDVQALVDGVWQTVASVRDNTAGTIESSFAPVTTTALRLYVTDSNDHGYSRVVEFETYGE